MTTTPLLINVITGLPLAAIAVALGMLIGIRCSRWRWINGYRAGRMDQQQQDLRAEVRYRTGQATVPGRHAQTDTFPSINQYGTGNA